MDVFTQEKSTEKEEHRPNTDCFLLSSQSSYSPSLLTNLINDKSVLVYSVSSLSVLPSGRLNKPDLLKYHQCSIFNQID